MRPLIAQSFAEAARIYADMAADASFQSRLTGVVELVVQALVNGNKLLFAGNGGSAAEAQHFSAELVGRYLKERKALPSIALSTDTSALTAIGNDYGYDHVFSRQIHALGREGDVLIAMSTSGRSKNILAAMQAAREKKITTISLTGLHPRDMLPLADIALKVPSTHTPQIQEGHLILGHLLCGLVESGL